MVRVRVRVRDRFRVRVRVSGWFFWSYRIEGAG